MTQEEIRALAGHPDAIPKVYIDWFEKGYMACQQNSDGRLQQPIPQDISKVDIIKKFMPYGIVNVKGKGDGKPQYKAEIDAISKAMDEYAQLLLPELQQLREENKRIFKDYNSSNEHNHKLIDEIEQQKSQIEALEISDALRISCGDDLEKALAEIESLKQENERLLKELKYYFWEAHIAPLGVNGTEVEWLRFSTSLTSQNKR